MTEKLKNFRLITYKQSNAQNIDLQSTGIDYGFRPFELNTWTKTTPSINSHHL